MIVISHRGNLNGPDPENENKQSYIISALNIGIDCEVDVWKYDGELWLGHDGPKYPTDLGFLDNPSLWIHAKNLEALSECKNLKANVFFHNNDDYTLTSKNNIWAYPGKITNNDCIIVLKNKVEYFDNNIKGICTNYPCDFIK